MDKFGDAEKKKQDLITCVHSKFYALLCTDLILELDGTAADRLIDTCTNCFSSFVFTVWVLFHQKRVSDTLGSGCTAVSLLCITLKYTLSL